MNMPFSSCYIQKRNLMSDCCICFFVKLGCVCMLLVHGWCGYGSRTSAARRRRKCAIRLRYCQYIHNYFEITRLQPEILTGISVARMFYDFVCLFEHLRTVVWSWKMVPTKALHLLLALNRCTKLIVCWLITNISFLHQVIFVPIHTLYYHYKACTISSAYSDCFYSVYFYDFVQFSKANREKLLLHCLAQPITSPLAPFMLLSE